MLRIINFVRRLSSKYLAGSGKMMRIVMDPRLRAVAVTHLYRISWGSKSRWVLELPSFGKIVPYKGRRGLQHCLPSVLDNGVGGGLHSQQGCGSGIILCGSGSGCFFSMGIRIQEGHGMWIRILPDSQNILLSFQKKKLYLWIFVCICFFKIFNFVNSEGDENVALNNPHTRSRTIWSVAYKKQ